MEPYFAASRCSGCGNILADIHPFVEAGRWRIEELYAELLSRGYGPSEIREMFDREKKMIVKIRGKDKYVKIPVTAKGVLDEFVGVEKFCCRGVLMTKINMNFLPPIEKQVKSMASLATSVIQDARSESLTLSKPAKKISRVPEITFFSYTTKSDVDYNLTNGVLTKTRDSSSKIVSITITGDNMTYYLWPSDEDMDLISETSDHIKVHHRIGSRFIDVYRGSPKKIKVLIQTNEGFERVNVPVSSVVRVDTSVMTISEERRLFNEGRNENILGYPKEATEAIMIITPEQQTWFSGFSIEEEEMLRDMGIQTMSIYSLQEGGYQEIYPPLAVENFSKTNIYDSLPKEIISSMVVGEVNVRQTLTNLGIIDTGGLFSRLSGGEGKKLKVGMYDITDVRGSYILFGR